MTISDTGRSELMSYLLPMYRKLARLDADLDEHDREVVARFLVGVAQAMKSIL